LSLVIRDNAKIMQFVKYLTTVIDGPGGNMSGNPGYSSQVITATGASTALIPTSARFVRITCVGSGGDGNAGTTGNNTANRNGGGGGGSGGITSVIYNRSQLPRTLNCWVSLHSSQDCTLVQASTNYTGGVIGTVGTLYAEIYCYAASGGSGGLGSGAGAAVATFWSMLPSKFSNSLKALAGTSSSTPTSGVPADIGPFGSGASTAASTTPGGTGGGKTTVAQSSGQGYKAFGTLFPAIPGGTAGNPGNVGNYYGGDPINTVLSDPTNYLLGYGGTGGGSSLSGTGGAGANGALGCGGGGGGAGITGGAGGLGGNGFILIETW
jgi:hypothetical protein